MVVRERIMDAARKMFRSYGVKGVTMFDIARDCGISKKTLYEHFEDKQSLISESMRELLDDHIRFNATNQTDSANAIEEHMHQMQFIRSKARTLNPVMLYEIEKYHPDTWKEVVSFKTDRILYSIKENLRRGITEGLYRKNLDIDIVARMRQLQLEAAFDPSHYPADQYEIHNVMDEVTTHYIMGITSSQGQQVAYQYLHFKEEV
ncbi:TetR/AcrR family transcriptional regulator [Chitinophaga sp. sic0106]|uniref:TetR/AcrR family transcriptional regulator n=1 Tax=Chitinophaga sp. sic0106 TaxID=2854785 RepID=UPI001C4816F2|nr:TetR/AcrR family transcriptional regulator [Chitinophaga sp. sic0106]MBV7528568.1 TetR/AcrR family transcriptional regulator [Chitinophaga sp. sic0106]